MARWELGYEAVWKHGQHQEDGQLGALSAHGK